jgi:tyrosinase
MAVPTSTSGSSHAGSAGPTSGIERDPYIDLWQQRIADGDGAVGREDWNRYWEELVELEVIDPESRAEFDTAFTATRRNSATPRALHRPSMANRRGRAPRRRRPARWRGGLLVLGIGRPRPPNFECPARIFIVHESVRFATRVRPPASAQREDRAGWARVGADAHVPGRLGPTGWACRDLVNAGSARNPTGTLRSGMIGAMSPTGSPSATQPAVTLRHRPSVDQMTSPQVGALRQALTATQAISDDRGYQHWAGIHGLPLPMYCTHGSPLFLAWHRAYLYFFELALRDQVPELVLPWWDWTVDQAMPSAYDQQTIGGVANPLYSSPIQPSGREPGGSDHTVRAPGQDDAPPLPTAAQVQTLLAMGDFIDFQTQLEDIHNGVHVWVGGTMSDIATAAYDPLFWAHHTMIDRLWRVWQLDHPHGGPPASLLSTALPPFQMTVAQTLDASSLGYDYAASTAATAGTS